MDEKQKPEIMNKAQAEFENEYFPKFSSMLAEFSRMDAERRKDILNEFDAAERRIRNSQVKQWFISLKSLFLKNSPKY